ncbi:MAG: ATP-dependent zinc metalloprotease FtsH, partial [Defluviitaleaceae bacterium]|nr:ATP-dependent zinc metalloprotease FtsH [Defluviitaleaceae bacterium]
MNRSNDAPPQELYTYANLLQDLSNDRITRITIMPDNEAAISGTAEVVLRDSGAVRTVNIPNLGVFQVLVDEALETSATLDVVTLPPNRPGLFMQMLPTLLIFAVFIVVFVLIMNHMQNNAGGGKAMNFGKTRARLSVLSTQRVTFDQVAGLEEEKEELAEIVDFLKNPQKYHEIGARIPRGVLLVGPPGTGKTFLARAVAGEAGVPFFSISGSDFVEMFVGVGASRVRDLFLQAKAAAPSLIMIDEIDAVGRKRGAGLGGGHDEREQTLNQLLVEMDGFGVREGVIVLAATNRPDILDPALLRPGRFDRKVTVNSPDVKGREAVLEVHAAGKKIAPDVSFKTVAQTTAGFTPADLENLLNESALLAARDNKPLIDMEAIRKAFIKMGIGTEKKSRVISEKERRMTAYHEAGHAICHEVLPELDSTYMVSVIPTGMAGGYVMPLPGEDRFTMSKRYMEQYIVSLLGGRAAEALVLGDVTTGASNDIERATAMARNMVMKFGMSDILGPIQFGNNNEEVFLGRDIANTRNYGEQVASLIDSEIKRLVENGYNEAMKILETHMD